MRTASGLATYSEDVALGGRSKVAVFISLDQNFDVRRLRDFVVTHLRRRAAEHFHPRLVPKHHEFINGAMKDALMDTMGRIHVFRRHSMKDLQATLDDLPRYLTDNAPDEEMTFLLIDGLSSFHWINQYQNENSNQNAGSSRSIPRPMTGFIRSLERIRISLSPVVVLTNHALSPLLESRNAPSTNSSTTRHTPFFRQHHPPPYPNPFASSHPPPTAAPGHDPLSSWVKGDLPLHCHLTMYPPPVVQFQPGLDLKAALAEESRRAAKSKEESTVVVRIPGVKRGAEVGRFEVGIRKSSVEA